MHSNFLEKLSAKILKSSKTIKIKVLALTMMRLGAVIMVGQKKNTVKKEPLNLYN